MAELIQPYPTIIIIIQCHQSHHPHVALAQSLCINNNIIINNNSSKISNNHRYKCISRHTSDWGRSSLSPRILPSTKNSTNITTTINPRHTQTLSQWWVWRCRRRRQPRSRMVGLLLRSHNSLRIATASFWTLWCKLDPLNCPQPCVMSHPTTSRSRCSTPSFWTRSIWASSNKQDPYAFSKSAQPSTRTAP